MVFDIESLINLHVEASLNPAREPEKASSTRFVETLEASTLRDLVEGGFRGLTLGGLIREVQEGNIKASLMRLTGKHGVSAHIFQNGFDVTVGRPFLRDQPVERVSVEAIEELDQVFGRLLTIAVASIQPKELIFEMEGAFELTTDTENLDHLVSKERIGSATKLNYDLGLRSGIFTVKPKDGTYHEINLSFPKGIELEDKSPPTIRVYRREERPIDGINIKQELADLCGFAKETRIIVGV